MFAVIFEVEPREDGRDAYLELAGQLKPKLEAMDGFIANERFAARRGGRRSLLSLSIWRDEKSLIRWRVHGDHHGVQQKGRARVFADYRIRVGEIIGDSAAPDRLFPAPQRLDTTESGETKTCTVTEAVLPEGAARQGPPLELMRLDPDAQGLVAHEIFDSIYNPAKLLILASWQDDLAAEAWKPVAFAGASELRHRQIRVIRDYGMFDRREAPQYHPEVEPRPV